MVSAKRAGNCVVQMRRLQVETCLSDEICGATHRTIRIGAVATRHLRAQRPLPSAVNRSIAMADPEAGDYMRQEYIRAVNRTRSPSKAWREIERAKNEYIEIITVGRDAQGVLLNVVFNFHEGSGSIRPRRDGSVDIDGSDYSIRLLDNGSFVLSRSVSSMRFQNVGSWQKWSNSAVIAGTYEDSQGRRYIFRPDGQAEFPGNQTFDYSVGLDMILTGYDYIYSDKLNKTWAIRATTDRLEIFEIEPSADDPDGVVSPVPRWKLKRLAP